MTSSWTEKDLALIQEASKTHPDFSKMEQLVKDGADVNAVQSDGEENALSDVILSGAEEEETLTTKDSLPEVIEFFLRHGFDPGRDNGRAGAKCLVNLTWSSCLATKIPAMKLLLNAGCRDIPAWDDEDNPDDGKPSACIASEASFLHHENEFDAANTFEALDEIFYAKEKGRPYSGIERYDAAYGGTLKRVFISNPNAGPPFFDLNEPTSKHDNCFRGSLFFEFDKGWLVSCNAYSLVFDTERPHEEIMDVSSFFASIIGSTLVAVEFDRKYIVCGTTYYGQNIIRYGFKNMTLLTTQTNFGEIRGSETVAYYKLGVGT